MRHIKAGRAITGLLAAVMVLCISTLFMACAAPSLPLAIAAGADPAAARHNAEGTAHYDMGHWEAAKDHFAAAVKADPKSAEAHYNLALALEKLAAHLLTEATAHFKKAGELAPENTAITRSSAYRRHVAVGGGGTGFGHLYGATGGAIP